MARFASKKQQRMMFAILKKPKGGTTQRGDYGPPASIAQKYVNDSKSMSKETKRSLPEDKGMALKGGSWEEGSSTSKRSKQQEAHRKAHKEAKYAKHAKKAKQKAERAKKVGKKKYGGLKKAMTEFLAFDQQYIGKGVGVIIFNCEGKMLLGKDSTTGKWSFIGGHVEDDETFADAAIREAEEETTLKITNLEFLGQTIIEGNITHIFTARGPKDVEPKPFDHEMSEFKWISREEIASNTSTDNPMKMRSCTWDALSMLDSNYKQRNLAKSEQEIEEEEFYFAKSISELSDLTYEISPKIAYGYLGNGLYRCIWDQMSDINDEEGKEIALGYYKLQIRKHIGDLYSGRLFNGQKIVHTFIMKPFKAVIIELLGLFDWQMPEDMEELEVVDSETLSDEAINGALRELMDSYRKNSLSNIYTEIENIRNEIRQNTNVDIQQAEARLMKIIDKLNEEMKEIQDKHNILVSTANEEIDDLKSRVSTLQHQIDNILEQPSEVYAISSGGEQQSNRVFNKGYYYLSKPDVASDGGRIKFLFKSDWTVYDQKSFLKDLKARIVDKKK